MGNYTDDLSNVYLGVSEYSYDEKGLINRQKSYRNNERRVYRDFFFK